MEPFKMIKYFSICETPKPTGIDTYVCGGLKSLEACGVYPLYFMAFVCKIFTLVITFL